MRTSVFAFGSMLLSIAAGHAALVAQDKPAQAAAEPQEQSVVDYESKTHGAVQVNSG